MANDYGNWLLVAVISAVFLLFLFDAFKPKSPTDWRTFGSLAAFVVALFAEMYGFPLTIYILTSLFGQKLGLDFSHNSGHILESLLGSTGDPHFSLFHIVGNLLVGAGFILIAVSWKILYAAVKAKKISRTGPYKYVRHPQYIGFSLIILGFLLQWPTIITLIMAPFLLWRYAKLARIEEGEMVKKFGQQYLDYKSQTYS